MLLGVALKSENETDRATTGTFEPSSSLRILPAANGAGLRLPSQSNDVRYQVNAGGDYLERLDGMAVRWIPSAASFDALVTNTASNVFLGFRLLAVRLQKARNKDRTTDTAIIGLHFKVAVNGFRGIFPEFQPGPTLVTTEQTSSKLFRSRITEADKLNS
ncbi:hypothetical protein CROQUDRAFT_87814 [Cronartium quercuum f. sp. fusiforme G11]|uniref:Uncharacterized protein n=1 Tax=Cronartium quercuum f. sp. fusiforme G11 TaxID=708437 RepID=A0A9P6NUV2_9BASI|nr:hypothetical protein CROQUDRAFT_87814 [Cronartium quercuum f. sp. fusiforme G11]